AGSGTGAGDALARTLVQQAGLTRRLLGDLGGAPPVAHVVPGPVTSFGALSQQSVVASSSGTVGEALGDLDPATTRLLDDAGVVAGTPVPDAQARLEAHLDSLGARALAHAHDPGFQHALEALVESGELTVAVAGAPDLAAPPSLPPPAAVDPGTAPDVDVQGRIRPLGIGDLKVVRQTLLAYEPGEVASIENVLAREQKSRVHRALHRTQTSLLESVERTEELERDTQTTDRFELKRETASTVKEDMSVRAGLQVTASYGPVVASASGEFAYSTAREDSEKASSVFAHDVVDRTITRVQVRTLTSRTTTTTDELEETSTHGVDNSAGAEHVVGVYRWVDKRYRAQVHDYGSRLMLELVVPEPAAFLRAVRANARVEVDATPPAPFVNDLTPFLPPAQWTQLSAADLTEQNYVRYAARYGATGVAPPPPATVHVSVSVVKEAMENGVSAAVTADGLVVPEDYRMTSHRVAVSALWVNYPKLTVQVGEQIYAVLNDSSDGNSFLTSRPHVPVGGTSVATLGPVGGQVPVSVAAYDLHAFALNVQGACTRQDSALAKWRLQTYDKIHAAYRALQATYDEKVAAATRAAQDEGVLGQSPAANRETERNELKKLCITMLTGQHFGQFQAVTAPPDAPVHHPEVDVLEALREGPVVQFFEQAFEWEQMTWLLYPYFWGSKATWVELQRLRDPDPELVQFLTAGSCRVVLPVPPAYADAVLYLLSAPGGDLASRVWRGGDPPTLDSPLYVSLAEELRARTDDLAGAVPEGEPWEFTLPTTLVWLQPDGTLPVFP
ncbi:hypothetical protein AB6N24_15805, partial [Cellulomonas sp. 179-A 4D5 NHS]|uniref:hypothetical protein n=1 Tax=Cellulomonas sp. 179-A 4D5 NHS TaxID=3142378 RepID=UPI0039A32030